MNIPPGLVERLSAWQRVVVIGHVTPDADALGAMIGVAEGFGQGGQGRFTIALPRDAVSQRLRFMMGKVQPVIATLEDFGAADGFVVVDTAKLSRCNVDAALPPDWPAGREIVNIDHHASNTRFGAVNWVDESASSTCELVYHLLVAADRPIDKVLASVLYGGILTDTVGFTLGSAGAGAFQAAADLVGRGADVAWLGQEMYRSQTSSEFALLKTIYANTHCVAEGRIAYATASYDEITGAGCSAADIDDQVNVPRSMAGVKIALLLTEGVQGKTRVNFRGEYGTPVLPLAKTLGGGGHAEAAGTILDMPVDEARPIVLARTIEYLDSLSPDASNE